MLNCHIVLIWRVLNIFKSSNTAAPSVRRKTRNRNRFVCFWFIRIGTDDACAGIADVAADERFGAVQADAARAVYDNHMMTNITHSCRCASTNRPLAPNRTANSQALANGMCWNLLMDGQRFQWRSGTFRKVAVVNVKITRGKWRQESSDPWRMRWNVCRKLAKMQQRPCERERITCEELMRVSRPCCFRCS